MSNNKNELQVFTHPDFGSLEIWIGPDGKPWFPAKESAQVLGYSNDRDAIAKHCDTAAGVAFRDISYPSGTKKKKYINRPNLSRLITRSHLPDAARFESWIFDEVLESVFDHGGYILASPGGTNNIFQLPPDYPSALRALADEAEHRIALETENQTQKQLIGELQPKADYVDYILSSAGTMTVSQIAADYSISANKLNKILHEDGIQRNIGGQWILYTEHMGKGYTKSETVPITRADGRPDALPFTKWTQKGRLMINDVLNARGIYANVDFCPSMQLKVLPPPVGAERNVLPS